jgi:hypothetical protein
LGKESEGKSEESEKVRMRIGRKIEKRTDWKVGKRIGKRIGKKKEGRTSAYANTCETLKAMTDTL